MISIVIPLYNKEHCIKETLSSILSQSYKDYEIVVVNDGSKDNSVAVVNSINDSRIRLINKENEGVSKTRNRGIKEAQGEWIMFLDADDLMYEGCLQALVDLGEQFPEANVLCGSFVTKINNREILSSTLKDLTLLTNQYELIWKKKWNIRLGSFIARKEILPQFPVDMAKGEDVLYCFNLLSKGTVANTPHTTMTYVRENSELSKKRIPLEECLSWNLSFNTNFSYLKTIYVEILIKGIIVSIIKFHSLKNAIRLLSKHIKGLLLYTPIFFVRLLTRKLM